MKVGIEVRDKDINTIFQILNSDEEIKLDDLLLRLLVKGVGSSDLLFLVLQKLERDGYVKGVKGVVKLLKDVDEREMRKVGRSVVKEVERNRKLFVTPLEVGKAYQCPRRLFLEKIALSRQYKERRGKTWDGVVVHLAINLFVKNLKNLAESGLAEKDLAEKGEKDERGVEELAIKSARAAIGKYRGKTDMDAGRLSDFVLKFHDLIKEEGFSHIFTERTIQSFKMGLIGTPDVIGIAEAEAIPIDIKLGRLSSRGVKEEHLLQSVGESMLVEEFLRTRVSKSYLIYFGSNSLAKIGIDSRMRRKFIGFKRQIERMCRAGYIPDKGRMLNLRRRVCLGCHVRHSCENIETLRRIIY